MAYSAKIQLWFVSYFLFMPEFVVTIDIRNTVKESCFLCICLVKPVHDIMNYINDYIQKEKESSTFLSHNPFFLIVLLCSSQKCKLTVTKFFFYKQSVVLMTWWGKTREACHFFSNLTRKTCFGNKTNPCYFMNSDQNH